MIAGSAHAQQIGDVFYIALENHNFTQPSERDQPESDLRQFGRAVHQQPGHAEATRTQRMVSYASNYQKRLADASSLRAELRVAGIGNARTAQRQRTPIPNNIVNAPNLSALLAAKGVSWRSYQEDTDLLNTSGNNINGDHGAGHALTNTVASQSQYEVPLTSFLRHVGRLHQPVQRQPPVQLCGQAQPAAVLHRHQWRQRPDAGQFAGAELRAAAAALDRPHQQHRREATTGSRRISTTTCTRR